MAMENRCPHRMVIYQGVDGHSDSPGFQRLTEDILAQRLASLVFVACSAYALKMPIFAHCHLPQVSILDAPEGSPAIQMVLDYSTFFDKALNHLLSRDRRKVAALLEPQILPSCEAAMRKSGLELRPYWIFPLQTFDTDAAGRITHLLMQPDQGDRPDGLIVADDNLVESALTGLDAAGVDTGTDIDIVTHCNWPVLQPGIRPAGTRLGFDTRRMLETALECNISTRQGRRPDGPLLATPVFEEECAPSEAAGPRQIGPDRPMPAELEAE
jgi:DNA-binding LacI/PurR family transcriptional regulator